MVGRDLRLRSSHDSVPEASRSHLMTVGHGISGYLFFRLGLIAFLLCGCTSMGSKASDSTLGIRHEGGTQGARLETDLAALLGHPDEEARRLTRTILSQTEALAQAYRIQPPALWHNFLVNAGIRDRGLCCHWTEDLLREIKVLSLQRYAVYWAVSRPGTWREHNCVVVTAAGQPFETGLVLDPWRKAGDLHWTCVADDSYPWQHHPADDGATSIRCRR